MTAGVDLDIHFRGHVLSMSVKRIDFLESVVDTFLWLTILTC